MINDLASLEMGKLSNLNNGAGLSRVSLSAFALSFFSRYAGDVSTPIREVVIIDIFGVQSSIEDVMVITSFIVGTIVGVMSIIKMVSDKDK